MTCEARPAPSFGLIFRILHRRKKQHAQMHPSFSGFCRKEERLVPRFWTQINSTKVPRVNVVGFRVLLNSRNKKRLMRLFSFSEVVEIKTEFLVGQKFPNFPKKNPARSVCSISPEFLNLLEWIAFRKHSGIFRSKFFYNFPSF